MRKTSLLKQRRATNAVLGVLVIVWVSVLARPGFLFAKVLHQGDLVVYSHASTVGLATDVASAEALLAKAPLSNTGTVHRLYLTNSYPEFALFAPGGAKTFGVTYPLLNSSFLTVSDTQTDTIRRNASTFNQRPLSAVIAHETSHAVLERHFGAWRILVSPGWKVEGYCDYVAGGHSVGDDAAGLHLLASSAQDAPAVAYFRGYLRMKYLLESRHQTVDRIFAQHFDLKQLDRDVLAMAATAGQ